MRRPWLLRLLNLRLRIESSDDFGRQAHGTHRLSRDLAGDPDSFRVPARRALKKASEGLYSRGA